MALAEESENIKAPEISKIPRLPSPVDLSSDEENDDLMIREEEFIRFVSQFLEQILMEHIDLICSLDSKLFFISTCSIRIVSRN